MDVVIDGEMSVMIKYKRQVHLSFAVIIYCA